MERHPITEILGRRGGRTKVAEVSCPQRMITELLCDTFAAEDGEYVLNLQVGHGYMLHRRVTLYPVKNKGTLKGGCRYKSYEDYWLSSCCDQTAQPIRSQLNCAAPIAELHKSILLLLFNFTRSTLPVSHSRPSSESLRPLLLPLRRLEALLRLRHQCRTQAGTMSRYSTER